MSRTSVSLKSIINISIILLQSVSFANDNANDASDNSYIDYIVIERNALPFPPGLTPQTVCDTNNMQDVELYDGKLKVTRDYVSKSQTSTLQLQWLDVKTIREKLPGYAPGTVPNTRWCTGTLLANNLVLTAGHCFDTQDGSTGWFGPNRLAPDNSLQYASPQQNATVMKVNFNYQLNSTTGKVRQDDSYPIVRLIEHNSKLDFAIFEIGKNAQGQFPSAMYQIGRTDNREPVLQETISIIQHPAGMPKKIDAGHILSRKGDFILYSNVDTMGGSSGSGIRDGNGVIIGVHTNGGCKQGMSNDRFANRGITFHAISKASDIF